MQAVEGRVSQEGTLQTVLRGQTQDWGQPGLVP